MTGFVYFIRCEGFVKIGWSNNPARRLRDIELFVPFRCEMIGTYPGPRTLEQALHRRFAGSRAQGEWFRPTPDLLRVAAGDFGWNEGLISPALALRRKLGISQVKMCSELGISQPVLSRIENGAPASGPVRRLIELLRQPESRSDSEAAA